jgi:hypothetical protein
MWGTFGKTLDGYLEWHVMEWKFHEMKFSEINFSPIENFVKWRCLLVHWKISFLNLGTMWKYIMESGQCMYVFASNC